MGMGSSRGNGQRGLVADINVTPLVDVMLVLLIIFMVTAPMMTQGLDVDLPKTTAKALVQKENPVTVSVKKDGKITLGKDPIDQTLLRAELAKLDEKIKEDPVHFYADETVPYGKVTSIIGEIKSAGFKKLSMITIPPEEKQ